MLKWVVGLCAPMYLVLVTYGEPTPEELAAREARNNQQVTQVAVAPTPVPEPEVEVVEATPEPVVTDVAVTRQDSSGDSPIAAPALVSTSTQTTTPAAPAVVETATLLPEATQQAVEEVIEQASAVTTTNEIWRVTARAVNLRAGPSTNNAVVGRATRNDSAEIIEMLPSGWAKVYILETGTEAFMSAQFLVAPE